MKNLLIVLLLSSLAWAGRTFNGTTDYIDTGTYQLGTSEMAVNTFTFTSTSLTEMLAFSQIDGGTCANYSFWTGYIANGGNTDVNFTVADSTCQNKTCPSCQILSQWVQQGGHNPANVGAGGCNIDVYYNGTDTSSNVGGACQLNHPNTPVLIGAGNNAGGQFLFFNGKITDVAYWDLSSQAGNLPFTTLELNALKRLQPAPQIRGALLTHYWPLHGLASPEPDIKGHKNGTLHGTSSSFSPTQPWIPPVQGAY